MRAVSDPRGPCKVARRSPRITARSPRVLAVAAAAAVAGLASPALADADSLVDQLGPSEIGTGEARRAAAVGAMSARLNPAGLPLSNELVFDGTFGFRPGDDASLVALAACDSTNALPGCFYYAYAGAAPDLGGAAGPRTRSHTGGATLSKAITPHVSVGLGMKYFDVETAGMDVDSGFSVDAGATVRLSDLVSVAAVGYNVIGEASAEFPRAVGGGLLIKPTAAVGVSADAVWNLDAADDAARVGGGVEYFASARRGQVGFPLRLGAVHDAAADGGTYVTGGLGYATMQLGLDLAARYQVADGDEVMVVAALRLFGPRQPR
jgi:hypothetical protein